MMAVMTRIIVAAIVVAIDAAGPIGIMEGLVPDIANLRQRRFYVYFLFFSHTSVPFRVTFLLFEITPLKHAVIYSRFARLIP